MKKQPKKLNKVAGKPNKKEPEVELSPAPNPVEPAPIAPEPPKEEVRVIGEKRYRVIRNLEEGTTRLELIG